MRLERLKGEGGALRASLFKYRPGEPLQWGGTDPLAWGMEGKYSHQKSIGLRKT